MMTAVEQAQRLVEEGTARQALAREQAAARERRLANLKLEQRAKAMECRSAKDAITAQKHGLETVEANLKPAEDAVQRARKSITDAEKIAPQDWHYPTDEEIAEHEGRIVRLRGELDTALETRDRIRQKISELKEALTAATAEFEALAKQELAMRSELAGRQLDR